MILSKKRFEAIRRRVNSICRNCKCTNPFDIADYYNVVYKFIEMPEGTPAYSNSKTCTIYIDKRYKMNSYSSKILCAHELGHIFLHYKELAAMEHNRYLDSEITDDTMYEYEANVFAVLLMPQITKGKNPLDFRPERLNRYITNKII